MDVIDKAGTAPVAPATKKPKYRFLFIQPFQLPRDSRFADPYHSDLLTKEQRLRVDASGLAFPGDRPKQWRRKKVI